MYNTGNTIPSAALEDMADNAQTFDALVTKTEGTTVDRLGVTRRVFQQILMDMGFQPLAGSFQTGATVTARNQALYDEVSHVFYAWGGTLPKVVLAGSTHATAGGIGDSAWSDKTDLMLRSNLAVSGSGVLISGKTAGYVVDNLGYLSARKVFADAYCALDGLTDDSAGLSNAIGAATVLFNENPSAGKILIHLTGTVLLKSTVTFNPSKVSFIGPCTIKSFIGGTYTNSRLLIPTDDGDSSPVTYASYYNRQSPIFRHISFTDETGALTLFHVYTVNTNSNNNSAALHAVDSCTFSGFASIFTHARGAWGWTWNQCGAVSCAEWMHITTETDTYERHTFFGCMWHNGGTAFYIDNPDGKVYWYGGSCDYSTKLANILNGHLYFDGHIEFSTRTTPLVDIVTGTCTLSGALYIVNDTGTYSLVNQSAAGQLSISNLVVSVDATAPTGRISNKRFSHRNISLMNANAETYFNIRLDYPADMRFPAITTYGTGVVVSQTSTAITLTSTVGAGGTKGIYIDLPISQIDKMIGWRIAYANSGVGSMFLSKSFMPENKAYATAITAGSTTMIITAGAFLSSVNMQQIPEGTKYLRFEINLNALSTVGSVTLSDFGLFSI